MSKDRTRPWAHNTETSGNGAAPVIIEDPEHFPFAPGEEEAYHEATTEEWVAYETYWNAKYDSESLMSEEERRAEDWSE